MSQNMKCEYTHKRGAKIITHIFFIEPDLSRDRAFFISPSWDGATRRTAHGCPINKRDFPVITFNPHGRESLSLATRCIENPKGHPLTSCYKLSKESRFLNKKWRFGGGITPPDMLSTKCAPHFLRGFFYRSSQPVNRRQPLIPPPTHRNR
jgi:hypothetical protein